jgi:hypothetical protein
MSSPFRACRERARQLATCPYGFVSRRPANPSFDDASRNTYDLMTQIAEFGLCGCRINPHRCVRMSSEIRAVGECDARILKGFRCRLCCLTPRVRDRVASNSLGLKTTSPPSLPTASRRPGPQLQSRERESSRMLSNGSSCFLQTD